MKIALANVVDPPRPSLGASLRPRALAGLAAACLLTLLASCKGGPQTDRFEREALPKDTTIEAIENAMRSGGYEEIRHSNKGDEGARITGTREGATSLAADADAVVTFAPASGDPARHEFVVDVKSAGGLSAISSTSATDLRRKIEQQLRNTEYNLAKASENSSGGNVTLGFPTGGEIHVAGKTHALIVGVSRYEDASFSSLRTADDDARAVSDWIKEDLGVPASRVHVLVNDEATRSEIMQKLIDMAKEADEDDLLFFYFAGHGTSQGEREPDAYLVPHDGEQSKLAGTCISQGDLVAQLDGAGAKNQFLMLDACFFGPTRSVPDDDYFNVLKSAQSGINRAVLSAATANQSAVEGQRSSLFTKAVLDALRDRKFNDANESGALSVQELHTLVKPEVQRQADARGYRMTPVATGNLNLAPFAVGS